MEGLAGVRQRFTVLEPVLDEKSRRLLVAAESKAWGPGGISAVSKTTGVSRQVIRQGLRELEQSPTHPAGRIRRPGGGRKRAKQKGSYSGRGSGKAGRSHNARRSGVQLALDLQERAQTGRGVSARRT